jgi:hypothetical protein
MNLNRNKTLIGIIIEDGRLETCVLRKSRNHFSILQSGGINLSQDLLSCDVELASREIRDFLDGAGIHEKKCVVSIPLS